MAMRRMLVVVVLLAVAVTPLLTLAGDDLSASPGLRHQPYRASRAPAGATAAPAFSPDVVGVALASAGEPPRAAPPLVRPPFVPPRA
jgi:hypothetical protein